MLGIWMGGMNPYASRRIGGTFRLPASELRGSSVPMLFNAEPYDPSGPTTSGQPDTVNVTWTRRQGDYRSSVREKTSRRNAVRLLLSDLDRL